MDLEEIIERYGSGIMHLAYFYMKDHWAAEDITQEVLFKAYQKLSTFRGESNIKTWLFSITANLCKDRLRSRSWRNSQTMGEDFWSPLFSPDSDPCQQAAETVQKEKLAKAVLQLPVKYREVTVLFYYHSLSATEIAKILDIAEGTVRSRLHRARAQLKEILVKEGVIDG